MPKLDPKLIRGIIIAVAVGLLGLSAVATEWGKELTCGICQGLSPSDQPAPESAPAP